MDPSMDIPIDLLLDRLYDELVYCIKDGVPLPNPHVYRRPWHRDAAMMAMVLERVGETELIRDWILNLEAPYDRNNGGIEEPDNLGQVLFQLGVAGADHSHPLATKTIEIAKTRLGSEGHLVGQTDFAFHPVYQTKWLNYGLKRIGLNERYPIPKQYDSYSALFWMDDKESHVAGPPSIDLGNTHYPYLQWAEAHFHGTPPPYELLGRGKWLTWESNASHADYTPADGSLGEPICTPHSWHAAEAWLYLDEIRENIG